MVAINRALLAVALGHAILTEKPSTRRVYFTVTPHKTFRWRVYRSGQVTDKTPVFWLKRNAIKWARLKALELWEHHRIRSGVRIKNRNGQIAPKGEWSYGHDPRGTPG